MIVFAKAHPATRTMRGGDPTPAQAASGKYPKERMPWHGLTIAIEHPEGTVREGVDETGKPWRTVFRYAYGEILNTLGLDGDPVDVFIGSYSDAPAVYIVQQMKRKQWDTPDEQKCMINFASIDEAKAAYLGHYDDPRFFGGITAMPVEEFVTKVRATRKEGKMIKSQQPVVLFFKSHVGPYLRGGKLVNLAGYQGRQARAVASPGQMSLFGGPSSGKPLPPSPLQGKDALAHTPDMFGGEPRHIENMHGLDANKRLPDHNPASHGDSHNYGSNVVAKKPAGSWAYTNEHEKHHVLFSTGAGKYASTDMLDSREAAFKQAKERMKARGLIDEPQHTEPTRDLIAEHERLVDVLNSPSHKDDKVEAKKQAEELGEMKWEVGESKPSSPMPVFQTYTEADDWARARAKEQGMPWKAYAASAEYRDHVYPALAQLYRTYKSGLDAENVEAGKKLQGAMADAGVKPGDEVKWTQVGAFLSQTKMAGVVKLDSNGIPFVHMGHEVAVSRPGGKIGYTKKLRWQPHMKRDVDSGASKPEPMTKSIIFLRRP